jgi:DNA-binding protein H-NS
MLARGPGFCFLKQEHEGSMMVQGFNFAAMSVDALWHLHEELRVVLAAKMAEQRQELDERLRDLEQFSSKRAVAGLLPKAGPVYRNPQQPSQFWSGRGLRPRWLVFQLAAGRSLEDFRVHVEEAAIAECEAAARQSDQYSGL